MNSANYQNQEVNALTKHLVNITEKILLDLPAGGKHKSSSSPERSKLTFQERVDQYEQELIVIALIKAGGHQVKASNLLGIKTTTLNNKIKRFQIPVGKLASLPLQNHVFENE